MMFSSTIIGIKLLPTTVLHHRHIGELMIGLLLLQDLLAIIVLMVLLSGSTASTGEMGINLGLSLLSLPLLAGGALLFVRYVLLPLIMRFDRFHEYIFLLALGWCLGLAEGAKLLGLSEEIGAFIAGITIATSPISQYIAVNLKPLRDFFLILFFFSVGARFDLALLNQVLAPALGSRRPRAHPQARDLPFPPQGCQRKTHAGLGYRFSPRPVQRVLPADRLYCGGKRHDYRTGIAAHSGHYHYYPLGIVLYCCAQLPYPDSYFGSSA